jgi:hypothetical protein
MKMRSHLKRVPESLKIVLSVILNVLEVLSVERLFSLCFALAITC